MKHAIFASALLAGLAVARSHGHGHKHMHLARDDNVVTMTEDVYVTETTTLWVDASDAPAPATDAPAAALSTASTSAPSSSSQAAPVAPTAVPSAPQQEQVQAQSVASSSHPAPAPAPAPAPSSSSAAAPAPAPAPSSGGSSAPISGGKSTHLTYNYFSGNLGACGKPISDDSTMVAVGAQDLNNKANCGRKLTIQGPAGTFSATAMDLCGGCGDGHLDIPPEFAAKIAGSQSELVAKGSVPITWAWA